MDKKYIIFDFDGTIANTNDVILASWQATFDHFLGYIPSQRGIEATFGETLKDTIAKYFPGETYEEVRDYYRAYQDAHCDGMVYVFDGVKELFDELKARGCKIGVATSRTANSFRKYVDELGIDSYFDVLVSMEDVKKHKPHPESAEQVLEKFGADPSEAIMIGDTKYDIGCANNAGVDSVMIGWSHYVDEEAMAADGFVPAYRIETPAELLEII